MPTYTADTASQSLSALKTETTDAVASTSSSYRIGLGDSFNGTYGSATDHDWIGINLVAGQTYQFDLGSNYNDALLTLRSANGAYITENDDFGTNYDSRIVFTATSSGLYFLDVGQYQDSYATSGTYTLTVTSRASLSTWTVQDMVDQIVTDGWALWGESARSFNVTAGGTAITVNLSALTATMANLARMALQSWTDTTGLIFRETTGSADITFSRAAGASGADAFSESVTSGSDIVSSSVTIDQEWLDAMGTTRDSYTFQTYIHEIGHAIGLAHAGDYNGSADWGSDNLTLSDSWQMTVMSYFSQSENTYINDTEAYTLTPMIADILAIAQMYGTVNTLRTGNTIYGEGTNAGSTYAIFTTENRDADETVTVSMTVVDSGGTDTFDFHSDTAAQRIDLRAGTTSDVYGDLGTVQIALGTVIENAFAGNGSDVVTGNDAANRILGNGGNDSLVGNGGNDTLLGGDGRDSLNGGDGNDSLVGGTTTTDLRDVIFGDAGNDSIDGGYGNDELKGGIGNDLILGGFGVDTLVGNEGNDVLQGEAGADLILGSDGDDIINGGFANDRIQGGAGADRFQHTGVIGHGSDWIQDYSAAQNDMLVFVGAGASISDFGVNRAITTGAGAAGVAEAFVVYRPNGQILWALIDGGDDATINLLLNGAIYDLVA